jgi:predicted nucleic acid-binding protein
MTPPVLVDTDVMVDFLRGYPKAVVLLRTHAAAIILPGIVVAELYADVKGDKELSALDRLISVVRTVPISRELVRAGGLYKMEYAKSHGVGLADAIVAATVEAEKADLKTLNTRHYPMNKGLKPAYTKTT